MKRVCIFLIIAIALSVIGNLLLSIPYGITALKSYSVVKDFAKEYVIIIYNNVPEKIISIQRDTATNTYYFTFENGATSWVRATDKKMQNIFDSQKFNIYLAQSYNRVSGETMVFSVIKRSFFRLNVPMSDIQNIGN